LYICKRNYKSKQKSKKDENKGEKTSKEIGKTKRRYGTKAQVVLYFVQGKISQWDRLHCQYASRITMRYYLDTNTITFVLFDKQEGDNIERSILNILKDYENIFYISSVAMRELVKLFNDGELKSTQCKSYKDLFVLIDELNYEIKPFTKQHVITYAEFTPMNDHKDPNDHMIIAQAISDRIPLISSDRKFRFYEKQGLQLVFNKR
jgi:PIN domain nuclease of toxin-antitoxin system